MSEISGKHLDAAAARLRQQLGEAAGADGTLSRKELEAKLDQLAPSERAAVDSFYGAVKDQLGVSRHFTRTQIDQAVEAARTELQRVDASQDGLGPEEVASLSRAGGAMVGLARKLRGARGAELAPIPRDQLDGLEGDELVTAIRKHSARHVELGYREAREAMFGDIDNRDGVVQGVYTGRKIKTDTIPDANGPDGMNTEHTRPKSTGVRDTPALSDLHHLFPTDSRTNARRSSFPFGEVADVKWSKDGSKLGLDEAGRVVFEPPDAHKGNVARSQFYVSTVYDLDLPDHEEKALKAWNKLDPVDAAERKRNADISAYQENRNPFVDHPDLAEKVKDF